jgi:hypothetical protein
VCHQLASDNDGAVSFASQKIEGLQQPYHLFPERLGREKNRKKIEMIVNQMRRGNIDIYLVQDTGLEGKGEVFKQLQIYDHTVFLHGNEDVTCSRGRGGVGIFLSKRAMRAWTNAGSHEPDLSGVVAECPGFMGMKAHSKNPGINQQSCTSAPHTSRTIAWTNSSSRNITNTSTISLIEPPKSTGQQQAATLTHHSE